MMLFMGCHCSLVIHYGVKYWSPLRYLGRLLHVVVLLHMLVKSHHILLALSCVSLSTRHCFHQVVSVIREVELVGIWRNIYVVV